MTWTDFPIFVFLCCGLWLAGILLLFPKKKIAEKLSHLLIIAGAVLLAVFIAGLWISLERPVFRTLGETRLWYAMFLSLIGLVIYYKWRYKWLLAYCILMSVVFLIITFFHPDTFDKTLMPALQSPWFIPHVIVYMISYAFLAASSLTGIKGLYLSYKMKPIVETLRLADNIVYIGFAFLTIGMLLGALWAKVAWGHYWTWDPKETWALLTWLVYLLYIHFRINKSSNIKLALWILALSFFVMLICWFGINYLPSAQDSVHVYSS
ncbi:MAG TPA: cytochrome c biogenesis protein CcsA [Bacteroidales bacterium]|nr:cytochrome c biogenesis protein CcsA [Bacteroidales bacterium]